MGWTSPFIPYLLSSQTHLTSGPLTSDDVSWIGSLLSVGGFFGTIIFGFLTPRIGNKAALFLLVIPHLCFWFIVYYATTASHLYLARTLAGLTGGGAMRIISIFNTQISESHIRGVLGSMVMFSLSFGILVVFIAGAYLSYFAVPIVLLVTPIVFLFSVFFIHDSPASLINRGKFYEAFESLKFYRTSENDQMSISRLELEFEMIKQSVKERQGVKLEIKDFCKKLKFVV